VNFLAPQRDTLSRYLPGLDDCLREVPLERLESAGNPAIKSFKETSGPGLLIPQKYGGSGATALEASQVQIAIGSRSPSLAVATTMHHFSVATLVQMAAAGVGLEWLVLEACARQKLLMASGFAEAQPGGRILNPVMTLARTPAGFTVSGSKKPCSLSHSMDLLTLSVVVPGERGGDDRMAVVLLPGQQPGIDRKPFWNSPTLAGAESDEVILNNVPVPEQALSYSGAPGELDDVQLGGFLWFELLITSSYLGMACGLAEDVFGRNQSSASERMRVAIQLYGAMSALEGVAGAIDRGERNEELLAKTLLVRYAVQSAIEQSTVLAAELLGGRAFIGSPRVSYFYSACRALAFHPPSRDRMGESLAGYLSGGPLTIN
jgi:alkylation response protein AidB-like acyl-CoA dehydrogenase